MSRYVIETYSLGYQQCSLKVVFNSEGYTNSWMRNSKGLPTVPYVVLEKMISEGLKSHEGFSNNLFHDYHSKMQKALYDKLMEKGLVDGAQLRALKRAEEISSSLVAIVVEEKTPNGNINVHCLNKNRLSPVAVYDESMGRITVDNQQWFVTLKMEKHEDSSKIHRSKKQFCFDEWWLNNRFLILISFLMLIILPTCMIWGMLYVKQMTEQSPSRLTSESYQPLMTDSIEKSRVDIDSMTVSPDTIIPEIVNIN